jgi:hypothetical protein
MGIANYISHLRGGYVDDEKEERIEVRVTVEHKRRLKALADANLLSISGMMRLLIDTSYRTPRKFGFEPPKKEEKNATI